jgi:hypothetical protein
MAECPIVEPKVGGSNTHADKHFNLTKSRWSPEFDTLSVAKTILSAVFHARVVITSFEVNMCKMCSDVVLSKNFHQLSSTIDHGSTVMRYSSNDRLLYIM